MRRWSAFGTVLALLLGGLTAAPVSADEASGGAAGDGRTTEPVLSAMTGGNTVAAVIREDAPRADGYRHIDTRAMIKRLKRLQVNTYTYGVWDSPTDWDDLRHEFVPAAERAGIDVWVYLAPPSECWREEEPHLDGRCSRPYDLDFVAWAQAIAKLSVKHPNVTGWAIDDFLSGPVNQELFSKEYLAKVRGAQDAINPDLGFYVTLYFGEITPDNLSIIEDSLDGVIYPYLGYASDTNDTEWVERRVDAALDRLRPHGLELIFLAYTGRFLDTQLEPQEGTVAEILRRVRPYVADGRVRGILSYAAPVNDEEQFPSHADRSYDGGGRLSLGVSRGVATSAGDRVQASGRITVDGSAASRSLSFRHSDPFGAEALADYQFMQVLIDDEVVWEQDVAGGAGYGWDRERVDLTDALAGKQEARLTFRLVTRQGVGDFPVDVGFDTVEGEGIGVRDGSFENPDAWSIDQTADGMRGFVDRYRPDRYQRINEVIGREYAALSGRAAPVERRSTRGRWDELRTGADNRAFTGNGRLAFTQDADTTAEAGTCASATQTVPVEAGPARYELSFWHADPYAADGDHIQHKELRIDDDVLWKRSTKDAWPWYYVNGSEHQGVIDVTEFVTGKPTVELELMLCADAPVSGVAMDVGFDHLETIGLDVTNPRFESRDGWRLVSDGPVNATIELVEPR